MRPNFSMLISVSNSGGRTGTTLTHNMSENADIEMRRIFISKLAKDPLHIFGPFATDLGCTYVVHMVHM